MKRQHNRFHNPVAAALLAGCVLFVGGASMSYSSHVSANVEAGTLTDQAQPQAAWPAAIAAGAEAFVAGYILDKVLDARKAGETFKAHCRENDCDTSGAASESEWEAALDLET